MKKKKNSNRLAILSPENYIRQKSRNLPLEKCYIQEGWEEAKLCYIFISRKHTSGNFTFCMYLVDLGCLGVKDTIYQYNVAAEVINELLVNMKDEGVCFEEIPYELAHNIIYAGIDFAKKYGFEPCRDFISVTSHFLDEDTDDIPYIDIDCGGVYGDPIYINSGFESPAREKQIIVQLEKTAGKGNYNIDDDLYEEDDDEEEYTEEEKAEMVEKIKIVDELKLLNLEEKKRLFLKLLPKGKNYDSIDDDGLRMIFLCNFIAKEIVNEEVVNRKIKHFEDKFDMHFDEIDDLSNSLFEDVSSLIDVDKLIDLFYDTIDSITENNHPKKALEKFRKEVGDVPVTRFLELNYLIINGRKNYDGKLKECYQKYPDYFLFKASYFTHLLMEGKKNFLQNFEEILLNHGQTITEFEAELFFYNYGCLLGMDEKTDLATLMAYELFINNWEYAGNSIYIRLFPLLYLKKIQKVYEYIVLNEAKNP